MHEIYFLYEIKKTFICFQNLKLLLEICGGKYTKTFIMQKLFQQKY